MLILYLWNLSEIGQLLDNTVRYKSSKIGQTKLSHVTILASLTLAVALMLLALSVVSNVNVQHVSIAVTVTFLANLFVAMSGVIVESQRNAYSIAQVHWMFVVIFLCIAPLSQYLSNCDIWGYHLYDTDYLKTNVAVFTWEFFFIIASLPVVSLNRATRDSVKRASIARTTQKDRIHLLIAMTICVALICGLVGFANLFSRKTYVFHYGQSVNLILEQFVRAFPVAALSILYTSRDEEGFPDYAIIVAFLMVIIVASPLSMSRYLAGVVWGGLALSMIPSLRSKRGVFALAFLAVFIIGFPTANAFRRETVSIEKLASAVEKSVSSLSTGFNTGDYDAYSMLARASVYVENEGITWGRQLLTVLLFFVPRSIWPGKGVGSGHAIVAAQGQSFTNVSCPFPAEGVINFGIVGLVAFAVLLAFLARWLDTQARMGGWWSSLYPFLCMYTFFIMRGDLLSSFAYMCGFVVSHALAYSICYGKASAYTKRESGI